MLSKRSSTSPDTPPGRLACEALVSPSIQPPTEIYCTISTFSERRAKQHVSTLETRPISAAETRDLRHRILRPSQSLSECTFAGDTEPNALHIGCFQNKQLIGIGSMLPTPREYATLPISWRIRGMAVLEDMRGTGAGRKILQALVDYAYTQPLPAEIWLSGRTSAKGFYERFGFAQEGQPFDSPHAGPVVLMIKTLLT